MPSCFAEPARRSRSSRRRCNHQLRKIMKRPSIVCLIIAAALTSGHGALAQERYPTKSVTVIVPQAAGGGNDAIARIVGHRLSEVLGQQVVIDNRPGAGGNIGTAIAAKAP